MLSDENPLVHTIRNRLKIKPVEFTKFKLFRAILSKNFPERKIITNLTRLWLSKTDIMCRDTNYSLEFRMSKTKKDICFYATICIKSKNAFKAFSPHFSNRDTFTIQRLYIANSFETLESTCHVALLTTGHCEKVGTMDTLKSGWTLPVSIHSPILKVKNRSMGIIN